MTRLLSVGLLVCLGAACAEPEGFDQDLLEDYREALPKSDHLAARFPRANGSSAPNSNSASFPQHAQSLAQQLNPSISELLSLLQLLVDVEPQAFSDSRNEFRWGPFANERTLIEDDAFFVSMRRRGEETESLMTELHRPFEYVYQLDLGIELDEATRVPIAWGGFNPDPNDADLGNGVLLYDLEAQYGFELEHDAYALWQERGRLGLLYDRRPFDGDHVNSAVVVAMRDYVARDAAAPPADLDYAWGMRGPITRRYHYLSLMASADLDEAGDTLPEVLIGDLTFLSEGTGRAEATALQGDIPATSVGLLTECWSNFLDTEYAQGLLVNPASPTDVHVLYSEGVEGDCTMSELEELPGEEVFPEAVRNAFADLLAQGIPRWRDF